MVSFKNLPKAVDLGFWFFDFLILFCFCFEFRSLALFVCLVFLVYKGFKSRFRSLIFESKSVCGVCG